MTLSSITNADKIQENTNIIDEVQVTSEISLFALEMTEPFYLKQEKKWYCVAFINRKSAWTQYEPQIQNAKLAFMNFYEKAENEEEPFYRIKFYKVAQNESKNFLEKLEYGRILNPTEEKKYATDREIVFSVPTKIETEKLNTKIVIKVQGDYSNIIKNILSSAFSKCGFNVADDGNYICNAKIDLDKTDENPVAIMPGIQVELKGATGKILFTCSCKNDEKTLAYSLENAERKAFPNLAEKIKTKIIEELK